ncbi:MAG: TrmB family transcriptional regulator [Nitrospirae bacterium]|nr:TrmB family transcriptional regulator [Nitrospirota bacterium]
MFTAVPKLKQLGFSEYEAKAYAMLVNESPLTAYEIAKNTGIPSSKIYEVIKKLEYKHMVQSIHGERSRMFVPVSPEEFIQNFRSSVEDNLHAVKNELKGVGIGMDKSYTWHIKDHNSLILKAKRMIATVRETVLLLAWQKELKALLEVLRSAEQRGVSIAIIHYGAADIKIGQLYVHPIEDTIYAERGVRGFTLVADSSEALNGKIDDKETEAVWSMNEGFVNMAEDYIRHDIYLMKTVKRFDPLLRKKFGERYEKLRDVFKDEAL